MHAMLRLLVLVGGTIIAAGLHILILGDSVDRHIVEDWCEWTNSSSFATHITGWGPKSLKYGGISSIVSPSYCENAQGDSIAQIHLFGSNAHGPYYSDKWEMDNSEFEVRDSSFRTTEGVRIYTEFYGVPDVVFLKTVNWDNALAQAKRDISEVTNFIKNTEDRLKEIESVVGKDVQLGVMTAPQVWYGRTSVVTLNIELREFAAARNLLIYDFDLDVWSSVGFHLNAETQLVVMRSEHDIHPKPAYSALAAEKILRRVYSGYYQPQGRNSSSMAYYSAIPKRFNDFLFVRAVAIDDQHGGETAPAVRWAGETLTYLQFINGTWRQWPNVPPHYLKHLHLGHLDVMSLLNSVLDKIEKGGTIPGELFSPASAGTHERTGLMSTDGRYLLTLEDGKTLLLNSAEEFRYIGVPPERIAAQFPARWLDLMGMHGAERVPQWLFANWTLIRQHDDKQVYVVDNYQRRPINSIGVFTKHGFDFDDVKVAVQPGLVALLPLGPPLD